MNAISVARLQFRWLHPSEGGRRTGLPTGPTYAATARFAEDPDSEWFSVVLRPVGPVSLGDYEIPQVDLNLLAPEDLPDVVAALAPGRRLLITEGARTVAEGTIVSIHEEPVRSSFSTE